MNKPFSLILVVFLTLIGCDKDEADPLGAKLNKTAWAPLRLELIEGGVVTRTLEPDPDISDDRVVFNVKGKLSKYGSPGVVGCGEWSVSNGKLRFILSGPQVIPNLCSAFNISSLFQGNASTTIKQGNLVITSIGAAFDHYNHIEDWEELQTLSTSPGAEVKVYFIPAEAGTSPTQECCASFEWM